MAHPTERSLESPIRGTTSPQSNTGKTAPPGKEQRVDSPSGQPSDSRGSAAEIADQSKQRLREGAQQGQQMAAELGDQAKRKVHQATDQAKETTRQYALEKKRQVAEELGAFSSAIQNAAKTLRDEEHDTVAHYIEAAAEQLDSAREAVEKKPIGEFVEDLQDLTRRRPELVFGGLFVVGMAAMRFAKASRHGSSRQSGPARRPQTSASLPARSSNAGPPPGFGPAGDGRSQPMPPPGMTRSPASSNRNP